MKKEVEILVSVESKKESAIKILNRYNFIGKKRVLDVYFYDPLRKDLKPDSNGRLKKCFRLRSKDKECFLGYKIDFFDNNDTWRYSNEHEIKVSSFEKTFEILTHLGFKELIRVDNEKNIFETDKYEIVLEDVKDFGIFMEVESKDSVDDSKADAVKKEIRNFINKIGIKTGVELNMGKPEMILRKNNNMLYKTIGSQWSNL